MYGEIDRIDGVSANIMLGQVVPCGTGDTILLLDNDQLDDIEGEVAKKIEAVSSLSADMILDLAMQFSPLLSSSQMKPWLNISMDKLSLRPSQSCRSRQPNGSNEYGRRSRLMLFISATLAAV
jgi:hypothetical protein